MGDSNSINVFEWIANVYNRHPVAALLVLILIGGGIDLYRRYRGRPSKPDDGNYWADTDSAEASFCSKHVEDAGDSSDDSSND